MHQAPRFAAAGLLTAALLASPLLAAPGDNAPDLWPILRQQAFGDRPIAEEDGAVVLEAPMTALDAAIVPITVRIPPSVKDRPKSLTLFIDQNPDPKVATLTYGPAAGSGGERSFNTRVRIERFSHVRAVLETEDGTLHMATKFVQAAGGCASMNAKDADAENDGLGRLQLKTIPPERPSDPNWTAQVMIKHPNSNGMQLDIDTGGYIPERYVKDVTVLRDGELVFQLDGTFSISTNPNFRFTFGKGNENALDVTVVDTDGVKFEGRTAPKGS
ncbi:quinoprotein dehydrogenase-associated SoxYZ-like carrier [Methyloceanibacter sp.]|uniref:quinoprotein dehydrogenase-associated SoxYZ-like carrier n=1 Tax=Methyloceanibacter sp. TaxID=1965321 RepID=UPI002D07E8B6|nr:quinoprotein dehydrogenase-associated SoxYZ-like carrier [Methyloceanibacter sp.]HML92551.1 quinoprotein dehydrogenase-associated SoxYZ-like carrier [Methyloceanibacter sp.]